MNIANVVRAAREFLVRNHVIAGEALAVEAIPVSEVPEEYRDRLPPGETLCDYFVGFCQLPVDDSRNPTLVICKVTPDLGTKPSEDNPIPTQVTWDSIPLTIPSGVHTALEIVARCRSMAEQKRLPLGELVNFELIENVWYVLFQRGDAPHPKDGWLENDGCFFAVDDLTGKVFGLNERF